MASLLNRVTIVLVDPLYGGNLGSVARAMANFGLERLLLVRPAEGIFDDPLLKPMARDQASHILEKIRVCETLEEALAEQELALGFTTRLGKKRSDPMTLKQCVADLSGEASVNRVAAVFGSEDRGLDNEDLEKCHRLVRIPTAAGLKSINLSQAVGLFAYELFHAHLALHNPPSTRNVATVKELEGLYAHFEQVLEEIDFFGEETPPRMMNHLRRILSRRLPDPRDVRILRGVLSKMETALDRAKKGLDR